MKLQFISTTGGFSWGGSEFLWSRVAERAVSLGHSVHALVRLNREPLNPFFQRFAAAGGQFDFFESPQHLTERFYRRWCRRVLGSQWVAKPSAYHSVTSFSADFVVVSLGSAADPALMPGLAEFLIQRRGAYMLIVQHAEDEPDANVLRHQACLRDVYGSAFKVCFVAQRNADRVEEWLDFPLAAKCIVRNPVNLANQQLFEMPESNGTIRLASVARLDSCAKGQDVLLRSLASKSWGDRSWTLSLFGSGPHKEYLDSLVFRLGLNERVCLKGHNDSIRDIWEDHHVLVMASRSEGTPLAMVEAMLCGRPAVVTDVAGMPEWIEEGKSGWVAEGADATSFSRALDRMWEARMNLREVGLAARESALMRFDRDPASTIMSLIEQFEGSRSRNHTNRRLNSSPSP